MSTLSSCWNVLQHPCFKNEKWKLLVSQNKGKVKLNAASDLFGLNKQPTFNQLTGSNPRVNMLTHFLEISCSEPINGFVWRQISQDASFFFFCFFFFFNFWKVCSVDTAHADVPVMIFHKEANVCLGGKITSMSSILVPKAQSELSMKHYRKQLSDLEKILSVGKIGI